MPDWADLLRAINRQVPAVRRAFIAAVAEAQGSVQALRLERLLRARHYEGAVEHLMAAWQGSAEGWQALLADQIHQGTGAVGQLAVEQAGITGRFDVTNPLAVQASRRAALDLVTAVTDAQKVAIRGFLAEAAKTGAPVRSVAKQVRGVVGLDARRAAALATYTTDLYNRLPGVSEKRDRLVQKYADKLLRQRATTIATTELGRAATTGQLLAWRQATAKGLISPGREKQWIATPDDVWCKHCQALHKKVVPMNMVFVSPVGAVEGPPLHPNCRCVLRLAKRVLPKSAKAAPAKAAPPRSAGVDTVSMANAWQSILERTREGAPASQVRRVARTSPPAMRRRAAPAPPPSPPAPTPTPEVARRLTAQEREDFLRSIGVTTPPPAPPAPAPTPPRPKTKLKAVPPKPGAVSIEYDEFGSPSLRDPIGTVSRDPLRKQEWEAFFGSRTPDEVANALLVDLPGPAKVLRSGQRQSRWMVRFERESRWSDTDPVTVRFTAESGRITDRDYVRIIRSIDRTVDGQLKVHHELFKISKPMQSLGMSKATLARQFDLYQQIGVRIVDVHANIDVGGYTWARTGFLPVNKAACQSLAMQLDDRLERLVAANLTEPLSASDVAFLRDTINELRAGHGDALWKLSDLRNEVRLTDAARATVNEGRANRGTLRVAQILDDIVKDDHMTLGQALLLDADWAGTIDLTNAAQAERLRRYFASTR